MREIKGISVDQWKKKQERNKNNVSLDTDKRRTSSSVQFSVARECVVTGLTGELSDGEVQQPVVNSPVEVYPSSPS